MFDLSSVKEIIAGSDFQKFLTDKARSEIMSWVNVKAIPTAEDAIDAFTAQLKEISATETGWCKIRDGFFLPMVFNIMLWFFKMTANFITANMETEAAATTTEEKTEG